MKKTAGDIFEIFSDIFDNHIMYGLYDTERDRQNFL